MYQAQIGLYLKGTNVGTSLPTLSWESIQCDEVLEAPPGSHVGFIAAHGLDNKTGKTLMEVRKLWVWPLSIHILSCLYIITCFFLEGLDFTYTSGWSLVNKFKTGENMRDQYNGETSNSVLKRWRIKEVLWEEGTAWIETRRMSRSWLNEEVGVTQQHLQTLSLLLCSTIKARRASSFPAYLEANRVYKTKFSQGKSNRGLMEVFLKKSFTSLMKERERAGIALSHSLYGKEGCNAWSCGSHIMTMRQHKISPFVIML